MAPALQAIASGAVVVLIDDVTDTGATGLVFAAETATARSVSFVVRHTGGFVCVGLTESDCDRLELPAVHGAGPDSRSARQRVTVDLRDNGTGISGEARARTIAALSSDRSEATDFTRPGHVVPIGVAADGVLERPGFAEAAVDLSRAAGLRPAGGFALIASDRAPYGMPTAEEAAEFAHEHGLRSLRLSEVVAYRGLREPVLLREGVVSLPGLMDPIRVVEFTCALVDHRLTAIVVGRPDTGAPRYVVQIECQRCSLFGPGDRCECGRRRDEMIADLQSAGGGVLLRVAESDRCFASGPAEDLLTLVKAVLDRRSAPERPTDSS